ncbi:uncharacterized protein LOC125554136 [Triticum urartu]|uniref:uncharacterized protein LOC125554136 n=1 Tax=Triticum urartu TaxID=4572 RepID=UPI0020442790|nr:uncharacterized protein LOC125554136 [Triticum urartu]
MEQALKEAEATVEVAEHDEHAPEEIQATTVEDKLKKLNLKKKPRRRRGKNKVVDESLSDPNAYEARLHRKFWDSTFAGPRYGSYETTTSIPPMRFTDDECDLAGPLETLQIFSIKVVGVKKGISWPLSLYGKIAARDTVDRNRNIIFDCDRDNCEILYEDVLIYSPKILFSLF